MKYRRFVEGVEVSALGYGCMRFPTDDGKINEEIAKREAHKGEYTIEDDGQPEPATVVSTDDVLDAMLGVM